MADEKHAAGGVVPLLPEPYYLSTIWAGDRLTKIRGLEVEPGKPWGIAREVCAYPGAPNNVIANGPWAGHDLAWAIENHHEELMGDDPEHQMIRMAYMDPVEDLSIQVHPVEDYAREHEDDREKSESWYVLEADPGAYVVAGTTTDDRDALRAAAEDDAIDRFARKVPVSEGDFILIPAGCMHACGKNMLAIEVGSFGGITYRICDYGRGRKLDIDKAFDVLDCSLMPEPVHLGAYERRVETVVRPGVRHRLFASDVADVAGSWKVEKDNVYEVVTAVKNDATVVVGDGEYHVPYTRSIIIPAAIGLYEVRGDCRVLRSWHPLG